MITLRTYSSSAEAAMAKSLLDDHQIVCSLADENSHLYAGTGQIAIPIRLLVAEENVEQALHILDDARAPLPDDFDPGSAGVDTTVDIHCVGLAGQAQGVAGYGEVGSPSGGDCRGEPSRCGRRQAGR